MIRKVRGNRAAQKEQSNAPSMRDNRAKGSHFTSVKEEEDLRRVDEGEQQQKTLGGIGELL